MKTNLQLRYFQLELTQSLSVIAAILCFGFDFQTAGYFFVLYAVYLEIRIIYFFLGKFSDAEEVKVIPPQITHFIGYQPMKSKGKSKSRPPRRV